MPMPRWVAQINKRFFNKVEIKRGTRPVITHVGRSSGQTYHTPLDAHRVDDGFIFIPLYGSDSDWVKNVLAAESAGLTAGGDEYALTNPRLITADVAKQQLPETVKPPPGLLKVSEYLHMDISETPTG